MNKLLLEVRTDLRTTAKAAYATKKSRMVLSLLLCLSLLMSFSVAAFASQGNTVDEVGNAVNSTAQNLWNLLGSIVIPIGVVVVGFAGVKLVVGGEKDWEALKKTFLRLIIGFALVFLGPIVINAILSFFRSQGQNAWEKLEARP